ncbi:MAG: hypothetical protein ACJ73D_03825 [Pyrinomonadaceae bacterium]
MFCPSCGVNEDQPIQFCRACGASFRPPVDAVTSSAISAREEIGRAMAEKIREFESSKDLKRIAEDVLPELEKFLESPAEKRLRRIRNGTMVVFAGIGGAIACLIVAIVKNDPQLMFGVAAGVVAFLVGVALLVNGYLHSVPKDNDAADVTSGLNIPALSGGKTSDLKLPEPARPFSSVTEGTTTHLAEKQPIRRD